MPTSRANASAAPRLSPLTSTARRPSRCSAATAAAAPGLAWSPKASRPNARGAWPGASSASHDTLRPCALQARAWADSAASATPRSAIQTLLPSFRDRPFTPPSMPRPATAWGVSACGTRSWAFAAACTTAQGQAMTSTDTAWISAAAQSPCAKPQPSSVNSAAAKTSDTKTSATWSTVCWIGDLRACADSTIATICDSMLAAPTAVVRTTSGPSPLIAPPVTRLPASRATGRLSPVSSDSSRWLRPSNTTPSVGRRSPGRTTTSSPGCTWASGTLSSAPVRRRRQWARPGSRRAAQRRAGWRRPRNPAKTVLAGAASRLRRPKPDRLLARAQNRILRFCKPGSPR